MITILLFDLPPQIYGCAIHDKKSGTYWVLINPQQCDIQRRFVFGHELAHIGLQHHEISDYFMDHDSADYKRCEAEANRKAWDYYRKHKQAFYQLQNTGKVTIESS